MDQPQPPLRRGGEKKEPKANTGQLLDMFDCSVSRLIEGVNVDQLTIHWFIES